MSNIGTKFNLANTFTFDPNTNSLLEQQHEEVIRLGSNESRILLLLCEKPNQVISRNDLHDFVWREQGFEVDDSSLTQAISTLRKLLKDSTKSPEFVKTVPKRGYQLICSVERTTPIMSGDESPLEQTEDEIVESAPEPEINLAEDIEREVEIPAVAAEKNPANQKPRLIKAAIAIALALPLLALIVDRPIESQFRQLAVYDNVEVKTPVNHPDLSSWQPVIERCVNRYNHAHSGSVAPVEVIATGGQNNQLVLNYIHRLEHSGENVTVRIFSEQDNLADLCQ
ncbi:winged helix-turn-helix domain-containing protein [Vibrio intestinalis]|uniref:winged helix-turn-helix domain-containing protein n=1 Tax=Vibrio intestinalis TaxID=2933291 RepID=UPI0021A6ED09|nr:transcriptional regulator [Vibrio intestinalis]